MKYKIFAVLMAMIFSIQTGFCAPFSGNAKTKRIPAGTELSLQMLNSIDTGYSFQGSDFSAMLITDQKGTDDGDIILPMGSVVRGSIKAITPAKRLSRGSVLYLDFDHVVTPNGRQIPLSLGLVSSMNLTYDGGITSTRGYKQAWRQTCSKSAQITKDAVNWGADVTDNGFKYVLIPISAIGGAFGTAGYFVYGSIADAIKKGAEVRINKGDVLNVILTEPVDIPVI